MRFLALVALAVVTSITVYRWLRDDAMTEDNGLTRAGEGDACEARLRVTSLRRCSARACGGPCESG
jgi:hypothetical protein